MNQNDHADLDVRIIGPDGRDPGTAQTPGLQRFAAVSSGLTGSQHMWMGYAVLEPGGRPASTTTASPRRPSPSSAG